MCKNYGYYLNESLNHANQCYKRAREDLWWGTQKTQHQTYQPKLEILKNIKIYQPKIELQERTKNQREK